MKKIFVAIIFFILPIISLPAFTSARSYFGEVYEIKVDENVYKFSDDDLKKLKISNFHMPIYSNSLADKRENAKKLLNMGFSKPEILDYLFPGIMDEIDYILNDNNYNFKNAEIKFNGFNPYIEGSKNGKFLDKKVLIENVFDNFIDCGEICSYQQSEILPAEINTGYLEKLINIKGYFETPIRGINQEGRINNIKVALSKFDGMCIYPSEEVSFNKVIGNTTKENGYSLAKVIINGKYEDDYGGGVCQAATTLYNALLYAGINVKSVRPHSLRVGYVEPSFDAMVSYGISDLIFENNTDAPIYIKTYVDSSVCKVCIFGLKNEYEIKRRSEVLDYEESWGDNVNFKSKGYLEYYKDGYLTNTKNIRKDTYYKLTNV